MKTNFPALIYIFLFLLLCQTSVSMAQSLPTGTPVLEDFLRRQQLLDKSDSVVSFTIRPVISSAELSVKDIYDPDSTLEGNRWLGFNGNRTFSGGKGRIMLLPLTWLQQTNTNYPYGWNDGAMIPAKGYQTMLSAGAYASFGPLSIQLRPELVHASNQSYEGFNTEHYDVIWKRYYDYYLNNVDLPEHFGYGRYNKLNWGQSNVSLTFNPVTIGVSTENLWWGPGLRNSLVLSNAAPGFKHVSLHTSKPVQTGVGSFEGQLISGWLENSGFTPPEPNRVFEGQNLYIPKRDNERYLSGFIFTYHPKWVDGLFLGASRTYQMYRSDMGRNARDFVPLISAFRHLGKNEGPEVQQMMSLFGRWVMKDAHAEIYYEYGQNSYGYVPVDYVNQQQHSKAWIFGLRKLLPLRKWDGQYIAVNLELTQLEQKMYDSYAMYINGYIRQGYTNAGQMLGAGIGPGSNLQTLDVSWLKGMKRIGLQVERFVHNNDWYYYAYQDTHDTRRHWVDFNTSLYGDWNYKNLLLTAKLSRVHSLNYQWFLVDKPGDEWIHSGFDDFNLSAQLGISYRF